MAEADAKLADRAMSPMDDSTADAELSLHNKKRTRWRRRVTTAAMVAVLLAAALVLPGMVNIGHYKGRIAALMGRSMGRPVRMSGVELRLLPTPGFVLHDLAVSEDPEFGAEPILFARTVVASIRVPSLLKGRIEISRVSVDEASLNLVRSAAGRWNLEALMMGAQPGQSGGVGPARHIPGTSEHFPYLEATNSRVNLKNGLEKSPFSIEDTDLSLWQDAPGQWRVRLGGQPMRTDIPMSLADTGEVRLEASLQSASQLRDMPLKLDMEWRNAQLGQLSRLITGSDAGWRGDLTADIDVQGTPETAQTKARLRATGVRRAEFAPDTPLDFDANCSFRYQHSFNAAHDVSCDTAIGAGKLHLKAELPGKAGPPEAMLEVQDVSLQAGLDLLRTVRSGFAPGIQAKGAVNGSLSYKEAVVADNGAKKPALRGMGRKSSALALTAKDASNLQGSLIVSGVEFSGGQLPEPLKLPRITLTPAVIGGGTASLSLPGATSPGRNGLAAQFAIPIAAAVAGAERGDPQAASVQLGLTAQSYVTTITGSAGIARLRELAYGFGWRHLDAVDSFSGGTADFNLAAQGPWIAPENAEGLLPSMSSPEPGSLTGTLTLHHAEWRAGYLARPAELAEGTITVLEDGVDFAGDFSYGKDASKGQVRGSVVVHARAHCTPSSVDAAAEDCLPQVQLRFGALDSAGLEAALLGAPEEKSLLTQLMDRMRSSQTAKWPPIALRVQADSLVLGPTDLQKPLAEIRFEQDGAVVKHWEAGLLGGSAEGTGRFTWADDKPQYAFDGNFTDVSAAALSAMIGSHWTGGPVSGSGTVKLSGRDAADLEASASGTVQFDWKRGDGLVVGEAEPTSFEDWSGTAVVQGGKLQLGENTLLTRRRKSSLAGTIPFSETGAEAVKLTVAPAEANLAEAKKAVK